MNTGKPIPVTTPACPAEAENNVERKRSNNQQPQNAGSLEPGPNLALPGNVNNAASKDKGPPLDAIPSEREPAAKNAPERNDPFPNQGGLEAPGESGLNESDKNVAGYSGSLLNDALGELSSPYLDVDAHFCRLGRHTVDGDSVLRGSGGHNVLGEAHVCRLGSHGGCGDSAPPGVFELSGCGMQNVDWKQSGS